MIWSAKFNGRKVGAIGITYPIITFAYGIDETMARMDLHNRFEHIMGLKLERRPITILKDCKPGDSIYRIVDGKLIGDTDPQNSAWKVEGGESFSGFVNCMNECTGVTSQLNDGLECIVRGKGE